MNLLKRIWGNASSGAKLFMVAGAGVLLLSSLAALSEPLPEDSPGSQTIRTGERITPDPNFTPAPTTEPAPTEVPAVEDNSSMAYTLSKQIVTSALKAPSTADFPWLDFKVTRVDDYTYNVVSYVDAENSFGAKIRSNWYVQLRYKGGDKYDINNWDILGVTIDGESYL